MSIDSCENFKTSIQDERKYGGADLEYSAVDVVRRAYSISSEEKGHNTTGTEALYFLK